MEDLLNDDESRLFDLMESKGWEELTEEEQLFVVQQMPKQEYSLQREIMLAASEELYPDDGYEPTPLVFYETMAAQTPFMKRSIPLYQALSAVAAVIILFLLIRPGNAVGTIVQSGETEGQAAPLQASVEKEYVYDTIVRYVTKAGETHKIIIDTVRKAISFPQVEEQPKLLQAANNVTIPELTTENLETRGTSLKDENTAHLVPKVVNTIY